MKLFITLLFSSQLFCLSVFGSDFNYSTFVGTPPSNDECAGAILLSGTNPMLTNVCGTGTDFDQCADHEASVWYYYQLQSGSAESYITFRFGYPSTGQIMDPGVEIYNGTSCNNLVLIDHDCTLGSNSSIEISNCGDIDEIFIKVGSLNGSQQGEFSIIVIEDPHPSTLVSIISEPAANSSDEVIVCAGDNVTLNATPDEDNFSWIWENPSGENFQGPEVDFSANSDDNGVWTVTVTNEVSGCTAVDEIEVIVNTGPAIPASELNIDIACLGSSLILSYSGDETIIEWQHPDGSSLGDDNPINVSDDASSSDIGVYTILVEDATGCPGSGTIDVGLNTAPNAVISPDPILICSGQNVSVSETAGDGAEWLWSSSNTGVSFTASTSSSTTANGLIPGDNLNVMVTDNNGCVSNSSIVIQSDNPPTVNINPPTISVCPGQTITVSENGGAASTWSWSSSNPAAVFSASTSSTTNVTGLNPMDMVTVNITDNGGCANSASITLTAGSIPGVNINPSSISVCSGQTVTVSENAGAASSWNWTSSNPAAMFSAPTSSTTNVTGLNPLDMVTVTIADVNGCTNSTSVTATGGSIPPITITQSSGMHCEGSVVMLFVNNPNNYNILWSTGSTNPSIPVQATLNNPPTSWSVTMTDPATGCSVSDVHVLTNIIPKVELESSEEINPSCHPDNIGNSNDGSITVNPTGGNNNYSYLWSNGATSRTITNLMAGSYMVTVTATNTNCDPIVESFTLMNPDEISITNIDIGAAPCAGELGSINYGAVGGTLPYVDGPPLGPTEIEAGNQTITVTDANGCMVSEEVVIEEGNRVTAFISSTSLDACENGTEITLTAESTSFPENLNITNNWSWNGGGAIGQNSISFGNELTDPGTYMVTLTSSVPTANGIGECEDTAEIEIRIFESPEVTLNDVDAVCRGVEINLEPTAVITGGNPQYTSEWSIGSSVLETNDFSPSEDAFYQVTVTDENGCTANSFNTVYLYRNPNAVISQDFLSTNLEFLPFDLEGSSSNAPEFNTTIDDYFWTFSPSFNNSANNPISNSNQSIVEDISAPNPGDYSICLQVTDTNGCSDKELIDHTFFSQTDCRISILSGNLKVCENETVSWDLQYFPSSSNSLLEKIEFFFDNDNNPFQTINEDDLGSNNSGTINLPIGNPGMHTISYLIDENPDCNDEKRLLARFEVLEKPSIQSFTLNEEFCSTESHFFRIEASPEDANLTLTYTVNGGGDIDTELIGGIEKIIALENLGLNDTTIVNLVSISHSDLSSCRLELDLEKKVFIKDCNQLVNTQSDFYCSGEEIIISDLFFSDSTINRYVISEENNIQNQVFNDLQDIANGNELIEVDDELLLLINANLLIDSGFGDFYISRVIPITDVNGIVSEFRVSPSQKFTIYPLPELSLLGDPSYCLNSPNALISGSVDNENFLIAEFLAQTSIDWTINDSFKWRNAIGDPNAISIYLDSNIHNDGEIVNIQGIANSTFVGKTCTDTVFTDFLIEGVGPPLDETVYVQWWPGNILAANYLLDSVGINYQWFRNGIEIPGEINRFYILEESSTNNLDFNESGIPFLNGVPVNYSVEVSFSQYECPLEIFYTGDGYQPRDTELKQTLSYKLFPNPTNRDLQVSFDGNLNEIQSIQILNNLGKPVYNLSSDFSEPELFIDLKELDKGIYFFMILKQSGEYSTSKFLKL